MESCGERQGFILIDNGIALNFFPIPASLRAGPFKNLDLNYSFSQWNDIIGDLVIGHSHHLAPLGQDHHPGQVGEGKGKKAAQAAEY
jgi:hypothetical protein